MNASKNASTAAAGSSSVTTRLLGRPDELFDVRLVDRLDDVDPGGEVAVEGPDADAGLPGDRLHGGSRTLLGEDLPRRRDEAFAIAPGVGSHRVLARRGAVSTRPA